MFRKILLAGIMLVAAAIIVMALQRQRGRDRSERQRPSDNGTASLPSERPAARIRKYDKKTNELIAEITGEEFIELAEKRSFRLVKPRIRILKDKNNLTVITADSGRVDDPEEAKMPEGWLKGHVVMTVTSRASGDNTVLTCNEMVYQGDKGEVAIPGAVRMHNRSMEVTGSNLSTVGGMERARLERDVKLTLKEAARGVLRKLTGREGQTAPAAGEPLDPSEYLVITCDGTLVYHMKENQATFEKNVLAVQGENRVRGDSMVVQLQFSKTPAPDVEAEEPPRQTMTIRRVAISSEKAGGVVVEGPDRRAWGDRFEYDSTVGVLVFTGSPCQTVLTSGGRSYRLEGKEMRLGRRRLLGAAERLPDGMTETSQKILIVGEPARAVGVPDEKGQPSFLSASGRRIVFDQDARIVWIQGDDAVPARAERENARMRGMAIEHRQKTDTRGERVLGRGPGRLEIVARPSEAASGGAEPTVVTFGENMVYLPDRQQAEFSGGVRLVDGTTTSQSRTLTIELAEGKKPGAKRIKTMTAVGDVVVTGEKRTATAEKLVHDYSTPDSDLYTTTLTAKPGETCTIQWSGVFCRSANVVLVEKPRADGKTSLVAKGTGKGYVRHQPAAKPEGSKTSAEVFEVRYEESAAFDQAALKAVFEGNVRVKRGELNLTARHVEMDFAKRKVTSEDGSGTTERLGLSTLRASESVLIEMGSAEDLVKAGGRQLVWLREKGTADLIGGDSPKDFARVMRDRSVLEAPKMLFFLKKDKPDRVLTSGGGHMIGYTRPAEGAQQGKLDAFEATWTGDGSYETLYPANAAVEPTSVARAQGNVHAASKDADVNADSIEVYIGPGSKTATGEAQKLEVRKAVASGNARAKMFMPEGNYYRYARGDLLEWDRLKGRMVIMSKAGEAVVWDNSNEWTGERLVVNRTEAGVLEAESTSGRRIVFYEEGAPKVPSEDAREWKPIY